MSKYLKDEINYHGFLIATRQIYNVTLNQLAEGICSESEMQRIEKGERLPEKLMRDRIMARMGISDDNYEDYLQTEEYERWVLRKRILTGIEKKQLRDIESSLEEYEQISEKSRIEEQFILTMRSWLLKQTDAPIEIQQEIAKNAVMLTMPCILKGSLENVLLSTQEIKLLLEYIQIRGRNQTESEDAIWCLKKYEEILRYIEQTHMDDIGKVKIYPKAVYYFLKFVQQSTIADKDVYRELAYCNKAIELLRNTRKLYYFVELVEIKSALIKKIIDLLSGEKKNTEKLGILLSENEEWASMIKGLYEEYRLSPYMENDCHLYWEKDSRAIGDVIRIRREMLGMKREELADGICSVRTLMRMELKQSKSHMPIVRELFERLGLCEEYTRSTVITSDRETMLLAEQVSWYINERDLENLEKSLNELEKRLNMDIPYNKQVIMRSRSLLELYQGKINTEEFVKKVLSALEYTLSWEMIVKNRECYMTDEEMACLVNVMAYINDKEKTYIIKVLENFCDKCIKEETVSVYISMYEFIMTILASYYGDIGDYDKSDAVGKRVLKDCMKYRRMKLIENNLYNNLWNYQERKKKHLLVPQVYDEIAELKRCILLAKISKFEKAIVFYEQKLEECE